MRASHRNPSVGTTDRFYENLPAFDDFAALTDTRHYRPLPDDWCVAVADVVGSTRAIKRGHYKQVNLVGAAAITAVINAVKPLRVPFVFGGDGATVCVPGTGVPQVRAALAATRRMARVEFDLELRVGLVPVVDILAANRRIFIAAHRVADNYTQAVFSGGGMAYAESLVKDEQRGVAYRIDESEAGAGAHFDGLECRWNPIRSPRGETISLLVSAHAEDEQHRAEVYRRVIKQIDQIYGGADEARPVRLESLQLTSAAADLEPEVKMANTTRGWLRRRVFAAMIRFQMAVAKVIFARRMKVGTFDSRRYQEDVVLNTDFRKFDDVLRLVLSGTADQRRQLTEQLEQQRATGELAYGIHVADAALLTCLVFSRDGDHVHFVDGADGGYALAAVQLKEQLKKL